MIEVFSSEQPDILRFLDDGLHAFNTDATGIDDWEYLLVVLKGDEGRILGGVSGHTWGQSCEIDRLWLSAELRGRGQGMALMQAAEDEASRRGCTQIVLSTYSFQAPAFYERLGFARFAEVSDHPKGHASIYYLKRLEPKTGV